MAYHFLLSSRVKMSCRPIGIPGLINISTRIQASPVLWPGTTNSDPGKTQPGHTRQGLPNKNISISWGPVACQGKWETAVSIALLGNKGLLGIKI